MSAFVALSNEFRHTFRSLSNRNFRLYFLGQMVSLCGTWMQMVALSWLVYRMTKSPAALGIIDCANLLPMLILGLAGGAIADKFNRRKVLLCTQTLAMCQAIGLATLTLTHHLVIWEAVALAAFAGTISAFEVPSRQALIAQVIGKKDLVNAISLNSSLFNGARAVGPAIAAVVVTNFSEGVCFVVNAVSYLAAILAIALIHVEPRESQGASQQVSVKDAMRFVWEQPSIKRVIGLAMIFGVFALPYSTLLPIFAAEVLKGDVRMLGWLRGSAGCGAVIAALLLASRAKSRHLARVVGYASVLFAFGLLSFSISATPAYSVALLFFAGFGMTTQLSGGHSLVQTAVSDKLRGRVMSIYMIVVLGFAPIGSLLVGFCAGKFGAPATLGACACVCVVGALIYLFTLPRQNRDEDRPAQVSGPTEPSVVGDR